jgi:pyruvate dehydrogenase E1 component alpha subunit
MTEPEKPTQPSAKLKSWYREMLRIRLFEEKVQELFLNGLVEGTTHLCQGQEAVPVGVLAACEPQDYVTMTYRGHGQALARGMEMDSVFAELMGRRAGVSGGLGGSMHLTDATLGVIGCFAIVGAGLPVAVGAALSSRLLGNGRVSVTFFGEGATNIGTFHEALNMASVWRLPVIFVCENNLYGEYSAVRKTTAIDDIADRAGSYGMPGMMVDGNDVEIVFAAAREAFERARGGGGPTLLECKTYRHRGHSRSDPGKYRPAEEVEAWMVRDPLIIASEKLASAGLMDNDEQEQLRVELQATVDASASQAEQADWPTSADAEAAVFAR